MGTSPNTLFNYQVQITYLNHHREFPPFHTGDLPHLFGGKYPCFLSASYPTLQSSLIEMKPQQEAASESFRKIVRQLAVGGVDLDLKLDLEIHKKLLSIFHVGSYYYYVFNIKTGEFDFMSPEVEGVLGYTQSEATVSQIMSGIHPEDISWFLNFENKVVEFFSQLRADQVLKYKVSYDYRIRKANGEYIRLLQQVVTIQFDEQSRSLLRTFGVHTDITHLKKEGKPVLSFIGLDGEPSYTNVDVKKIFTPTQSYISKREKQVLQLLIEGKSSRTIADQLYISIETVKKHRRNMLRKTESASTPELAAQAIKNGWL
jgi:DNA-binding CsgD family transcriptional regulator/PAS domain-containing protein